MGFPFHNRIQEIHTINITTSYMQKPNIIGEKDLYDLRQLLGSGAYSNVYKGVRLSTKQTVAIKKMKKLTKATVEMVTKEIQIMSGLTHKNIVQYITNFRHKGEWYIVLEYCGKGDMEDYKKKVGKIPEFHCKLFVKCILEALIFMHSQKNIAHRDLKLSNILITDDYQLKLADFGFSKDYQEGYFTSFCGSPIAMAPEILKREKYSLKCDVWSLGVLTFMMLYGRPPYFPTKSDGSDFQGLVNAVIRRKHKFDANVKVSDNGMDFINRCLQKSAENRPSTLELKSHPWFKEDLDMGRTSIDRRFALQSSMNDDQANSVKLCKMMFFGAFQQNLKKISVAAQLNQEKIKEMLRVLREHYLASNVRQYYLLLAKDNLQSLASLQTIFVIEETIVFRVHFKNVANFNKFYTQINAVLDKELSTLHGKSGDKTKNEELITQFVLKELGQLMEATNEADVADKLRLLKNICSMMRKEEYESKIVIRWGCNSEFDNVSPFVVGYLDKLKDTVMVEAINEELSNNDDIETVWLIEYQLQAKQGKSDFSETIKLFQELLSIPSNFIIDKFMQTERIELSENLMSYT